MMGLMMGLKDGLKSIGRWFFSLLLSITPILQYSIIAYDRDRLIATGRPVVSMIGSIRRRYD